MNKKYFKLSLLGMITATIFNMVVYAAPTGFNPGSSSSSVSYSGTTELKETTNVSSTTYTSSTGGKNALLISGGTITASNLTITKTGDSSDENADFYGTNAAVLVYNGATLNMTGGTVTTTGGHANAVFAYGTGIININDTVINTTNNNSGGIMVTGGGTLNAKNLTVLTQGNSSASIRSDRGGGTLTLTSGTYTTNGTGSPAIYSTANITANDADLVSNASEGVVIEGANSVSLNHVNLTDNNTTLNGNSETYKNIFLYQSQSGDATTGTSSFNATESNITTQNGDTFFVTNTKASITLSGNTFTNASGDFLRVQAGKWGTSGSNGGDVTLNLNGQNINGNIIIDDISTLTMNLTSGSYYRGIINSGNLAAKVDLTLTGKDIIVLNGDSYVTSLTNEDNTNSNIYSNGYTLYVNGVAVTTNTNAAPTSNGSEELITTTTTSESSAETQITNTSATFDFSKYIIFVVLILIIAISIVIMGKRRNKIDKSKLNK